MCAEKKEPLIQELWPTKEISKEMNSCQKEKGSREKQTSNEKDTSSNQDECK